MNNQRPNDVEIKRLVLENKIQAWRNTLYDAELDIEVAKVLDDERVKEQAAKRMKDALKVIDALEKMLSTMMEEKKDEEE